MSTDSFSPVVDSHGNTSKRKVIISSINNDADVSPAATGEHIVDSGMASFLFEWPTSFQEMLELSWGKLIFGYALLMTTCVFVFATFYQILCMNCGAANCDFVGALLFAVVSLSSNGGYVGEDAIMLTWRTPCFPWRTNIIFIAGLTGACFVSAGAALVVGKASRHTSLRHRIAFTHQAVVHRLETASGAKGPLVLQFRLANVHMRPLFNVSIAVTAAVVRPRSISLDDVTVEVENVHVTVGEEQITPATTADRERVCFDRIMQQSEQPTPLPCHLWYPVTVTHWLEDPASPLAALFAADGVGAALRNGVQFVCQITGVDPLNGANVVVRKAYSIDNIRMGYRFSSTSLLKSMRSQDHRRHIFVDLETFNSTTLADHAGASDVVQGAAADATKTTEDSKSPVVIL
jgi:hypothetical protein